MASQKRLKRLPLADLGVLTAVLEVLFVRPRLPAVALKKKVKNHNLWDRNQYIFFFQEKMCGAV